MVFLRSLLLPLLQLSLTSAKQTDEEHAENLVAWLKEEEGFFSPKLEMRRMDPEDPTSFFGMYAKGDFKEGDLMIRVPTDLILNSGEDEDEEVRALNCGLAFNLAEQINLKDDSPYAPYINYLLDTQPPGMLPSAWSAQGKRLLTSVLGGTGRGSASLPPAYPLSWVEDDWLDLCDGTKDATSEYAALLVVQRAWDDILIPVFDMMSHRNGEWLNTMSNEVHDGEPIKVRAKRDIKAGEQIYTTYNHCEDCGNRYTTYGTPEILRDYGFIEQFPQTWIFHDQEVGFRIDQNEDGVVSLVEWVEEEPDEDEMVEMQELLEQVGETKKKYLASKKANVPDNEWQLITDYMNSLEVAIIVAIDTFNEENNFGCVEEGTCTIALDKYTDLEESYGYVEADFTGHECDIAAIFTRFDDEFEDLEEGDSHYQHIIFSWDPKTRETCMDLDNVVQICDAYRPHYHEMAVHNTARFLPPDSVKRVLFVGGGDSMLLHEVLMYDSLEFVVGLELDQKVTRGSFRHFGTQPHFHNDKVQWWFGDASKSLLMLPKEWFGTFDLVLVDLSETVMSFKVTGELDVLEALTLLVKPDGIFVKNEVYFSKFQNMFKHSAQINWYDNPVICSQVMGMGSEKINFIKPTLTDHGIDGFVVRPMDEIDDHFDLYHDYGKNDTSIEICDSIGDLIVDTTDQTRSPGIILIVETEGATIDLFDSAVLEETLTSALKKEGLNVISAETKDMSDGLLVSIVLSEGYVTARALPESNYCGFDIHFWSSLEKHESAKRSLIAAVGSENNPKSSYRVIAGGMFGVSSWKVDEKKRGPQYDEICADYSKIDVPEKKHEAQQSDIYSVMAHSLNLLESKSLKVAVLCGSESASDCEEHTKVIESLDTVDDVLTFSCSKMANFNPYAQDSSEIITSCEREILETLKGSASDITFDAVVIDASAEQYTASALLRSIASRKSNREAILQENALFLSTQTDESDEWHQNLLALVKDEVFGTEPSYYSEVLVNTNTGTFNLLLASDGDDHFINKLNATMDDLEKETGYANEVSLIHGGYFIYQHNFEPSYSYTPDDFDQTSPYDQWKTQKPLGFQIVAQLETKSELTVPIIRDALKSALYTGADNGSIAEYADLGDGCLFIDSWAGGSVTVLWDGKAHVDLNYFTLEEDFEKAQKFEAAFRSGIPKAATILRDEQPRGVGRVVSFKRDLEADPEPHWA